jgi:hypothetical protein
MDYRSLLVRYMAVVLNSEGIDYVDRCYEEFCTDSEHNELEKISNEASNELKRIWALWDKEELADND